MRTNGWLSLAFAVVTASAIEGCSHRCGLGEHARVTAEGGVAAAGSTFQDVTLAAETSDPEFSLASTASVGEAADAFLVPTSCDQLFDQPYPGATPRCTVYAGPVKPGAVSDRVKLTVGSYRVYVQAYASSTSASKFLVDVYTWDYSCRPLLQ